MQLSSTLFGYKCSCGYRGKFEQYTDSIRCQKCKAETPQINGITVFTDEQSNQTQLFDSIYSEGHLNATQQINNIKTQDYESHAEFALQYLRIGGYDLDTGLNGISILDAACGTGWTSAACLKHQNINNCKIHAFDISINGLHLLKEHTNNFSTTNTLELSVQDAEAMCFAPDTFDVIIGSSILHHFDDYNKYLKGCLDILKPGGKAIFGEPFAIGYGLLYSSMKLAADTLGLNNEMINAMYADISNRVQNANNPSYLKSLVDKHLFYSDGIITTGKNLGYSNIEIIPMHDFSIFEGELIRSSCVELGIHDQQFIDTCNNIYQTIFQMFKSEKEYKNTISPFNYIVFEK